MACPPRLLTSSGVGTTAMRPAMQSSACSATMRPNRTNHAPGSESSFMIRNPAVDGDPLRPPQLQLEVSASSP